METSTTKGLDRQQRPAVALAIGWEDESGRRDAKALGARWDKPNKCWYVPEGIDPAPFSKWLPRTTLAVGGAGSTPREQFQDFLAASGIDEPDPDTSPGKHRARTMDDRRGEKSAVYKYFDDGDRPGWYAHDYRTGVTTTGCWQGAGLAGDDASRRALRFQSALDGERRREEAEAAMEERAAFAATLAKALPRSPRGDAPTYFDRKGVRPMGDARFDGTTAVIVYRNAEGRPRTVQRIPADPGKGKTYLKDAEKHGCYATLRPARDGAPIFVAEGYATASTCADISAGFAKGAGVYCSGDASSLLPVCEALRESHPSSVIVVCADDDHETEARGLPNRGLEAGREAAEAVGGVFAPAPVRGLAGASDWNDLAAGLGRRAEAEAALGAFYAEGLREGFARCLGKAQDAEPGLPAYEVRGTAWAEGACAAVSPGWYAVCDGERLAIFQTAHAGAAPATGQSLTVEPGPNGPAWASAEGSSPAGLDRLFELCSQKRGGRTEAVGLIASGVDPEALGQGGLAPLHAAARSGNPEALIALLEAGVPADSRDSKGRTAMHWAAYEGRIGAMETLLSAGADISARDSEGRTPLDAARLGERKGAAAWVSSRAPAKGAAARQAGDGPAMAA